MSARQKEDQRLTGLIKQFWLESGGVYGYRKITDDLQEVGESCGKHRYKSRNLIERFFLRLKHFRRIATRYDKLAVRFEAFISIVAAFIWLA